MREHFIRGKEIAEGLVAVCLFPKTGLVTREVTVQTVRFGAGPPQPSQQRLRSASIHVRWKSPAARQKSQVTGRPSLQMMNENMRVCSSTASQHPKRASAHDDVRQATTGHMYQPRGTGKRDYPSDVFAVFFLGGISESIRLPRTIHLASIKMMPWVQTHALQALHGGDSSLFSRTKVCTVHGHIRCHRGQEVATWISVLYQKSKSNEQEHELLHGTGVQQHPFNN
jgi:hypothetical protein